MAPLSIYEHPHGDSLHEAQWSMYFQMPTRIALYENGKIINVRQWKLN